MNTKALLKGKIAEYLTELLLEQSGYQLVRIASEGLLNGVRRVDVAGISKSQSAGQIVTAPPFCVVASGKKVVLFKVSYRSAKSNGSNARTALKRLKQYWPEAYLVSVNETAPHFTVLNAGESVGEVDITHLFPKIKKATLSEIGGLVSRFSAL